MECSGVMIRGLLGPDKGQREPGWMVSVTRSTLLSALLRPKLLLSRGSWCRPRYKTTRGPGARQISARPSSFLLLSPDSTFLSLPPGLLATSSEASYSQEDPLPIWEGRSLLHSISVAPAAGEEPRVWAERCPAGKAATLRK